MPITHEWNQAISVTHQLFMTNEEQSVWCEGYNCSKESWEAFCCIYLLTLIQEIFVIFCVYLGVLVLKRRIPVEAALQQLGLFHHLLGRRRQEAPLRTVQAVSHGPVRHGAQPSGHGQAPQPQPPYSEPPRPPRRHPASRGLADLPVPRAPLRAPAEHL